MDTHGDDREALRQLLAEWASPPAEMIDVIPKGGVELKYLGHAATTRALLECDPTWWWEPMSFDENGQPRLVNDDQGRPVGLWIYLHLCGVRRPGYGSCLPGKGDAVKELIGDAIRNSGMRAGIGLSLWMKDHPEKDKPAPRKAKATPLPSPVQETHDDKADGKDAYQALVEEHGKDLVNGAMAMYGVARFSELTPDRVDEIQRSLKLRENAQSHADKAAANDPPPLA
jgi:hypothetical protein